VIPPTQEAWLGGPGSEIPATQEAWLGVLGSEDDPGNTKKKKNKIPSKK
jgi:hypothetical protein